AIEVMLHPELLQRWHGELVLRGDFTALLAASALVFPKLALGMSGFETGVAVMPLIAGGGNDAELDPDENTGLSAAAGRGGGDGAGRQHDDGHRHADGHSDTHEDEISTAPPSIPFGRVRAARKLLLAAALIMSVLLLGSSFVTAVLLTPHDVGAQGPASGRALAYLAHRLLGHAFGTVYDLSTILILWFAGASAMAGMLNLVPRYLPRFGMAPRWVSYARPLVIVLFAIDVLVTLAFHANVEAQGGAYATGVLVLMLSAGIAVALA